VSGRGSIGGPFMPSILHRPSGDAEKRFVYTLEHLNPDNLYNYKQK